MPDADTPAALIAQCPPTISLTQEMDTLLLTFPDRLPPRNFGNYLMLVLIVLVLGMATVVGIFLIPVALVLGAWWLFNAQRRRQDGLRLSPHTLQVDDREPFLLENITQIEVCPPQDSRWIRVHTRDGVFDVIGGLLDHEAEWMGQLISLRVRHRWAQLAEEGHDLRERGRAPDELLLLR